MFEFKSGFKLTQTIHDEKVLAFCFCQQGQQLVTATDDGLVLKRINDVSQV